MLDNSKIFAQILAKLMTKAACVSLINELNAIQNASYLKDTSSVVENFLKLSKDYNSIINPGFTHDSSISEVLTYIDDFINYLSHLECVEITLAFQPSLEFTKTLYDWLNNYFTFPFYIYFLVSEEIGGGIVISYKGFYVDLSLKKAIDTYFALNKDYVFAKL